MQARLLFAVTALSLIMPGVAAGQGPISVHAVVGTHVSDRGNNQTIGVGVRLNGRWELLISAERFHVPTRVTREESVTTARRGGTTKFISGEVRFVPVTFSRLSPYLALSVGRGRSRPNVNEIFSDPVTNPAKLLFIGGGVRAAVTRRLSAFADLRVGYQGERDSIYALMPVRAGVAWRF
jgi:hypothetical protein